MGKIKETFQAWEEDKCYVCGQESDSGVCQGCQEVEACCDCTKLSREEYETWLKLKP